MHFTMHHSIQRKTANLPALVFVITAQLNLSATEMSVAILLSLRNTSQFMEHLPDCVLFAAAWHVTTLLDSDGRCLLQVLRFKTY